MESDNLKETLTDSIIRLEAMTRLLIEKGIITKRELDVELVRVRNQYEKIDDIEPTEDYVLPPDEPEVFIPEPVPEETERRLPNNVKLIEGQVICDDPVSANEICGPCIAQNTALLPSAGVKDICGLPLLMKKEKKLNKTQALKGVNQECWMYMVAYKMLDAEENRLIRAEDVPVQMAIAAEHIETAIGQDIPVQGILSIIDCLVLEALADEDVSCTKLGQEKSEVDDEPYIDIDWQH
ncbi:MAG: hypothetical protein GY749_44275 [Desulfobacteraceae bacterium]|nr:hypothetical protein [Desulfobacteraceae bacterium]